MRTRNKYVRGRAERLSGVSHPRAIGQCARRADLDLIERARFDFYLLCFASALSQDSTQRVKNCQNTQKISAALSSVVVKREAVPVEKTRTREFRVTNRASRAGGVAGTHPAARDPR